MTHNLDNISSGDIVTIRDQLMKRKENGERILRLESGDPSFCPPVWVLKAIDKALFDGCTHYTESSGIRSLRKAILEKVIRENNLKVDDEEEIIVTNGAMHALFLVFQCLIEDGYKKEIIIPNPMWTEISENIRLAKGVPVYCEKYTSDEIEKLINPHTRAIFINSPHNPTGEVLSKQELQKIAQLAEKHGLYIISDEAYEHIIFDDLQHFSIASFPEASRNTISIFSSSKSYAMSGLRVGYIVSQISHINSRIKKLLRCTTNGVNSIAQYGLMAALLHRNMFEQKEYQRMMCESYQERRDTLVNAIGKNNELIIPKIPSGGFFLWLKINSITNQFSNLFLKEGIGNVPGRAFGPSNEQYMRLSFSCQLTQIREAATIIKELLNK